MPRGTTESGAMMSPRVHADVMREETSGEEARDGGAGERTGERQKQTGGQEKSQAAAERGKMKDGARKSREG
ncbi:hypothetical protein NDU88_003431 [Pleurodeles waltl]|uniref:Uncharacterized protein n=1 Tax=Pleurodeles waltl TaxID=8319 RepID=A0AAV7T5S3_PLEWA|nr:hypothetical protein NDU88_003431 [Pleurodeles waltl]